VPAKLSGDKTNNIRIPLIKIKISTTNTPVRALVDTGSATNVIKKKLVSCIDTLTNGPRYLISASGTLINILGKTVIDVNIGEKIYKIDFLIVETLPRDIILGTSFLVSERATLDFDRRELCLTHSNRVPFELSAHESVVIKQGIKRNYKVSLAGNNVIVANEDSYINVNFLGENDINEEELKDSIFVPNEHFMLTHRCKILPDLGKRQVLIQLQGYPTKKLFEGTVVGHLVPPIAEQTPSYIVIEDNAPENTPITYNVNESLNKEEKEALQTLLSDFRDVFATKTSEMGFTNLVEHHINTGEAAPVHSKPYRVSQKERDVIQAQVQEMLEHDIIRPSKSCWSSPVVLVKKKDNSYRFCVDYRKLNAVTKRDVYPLPVIDDILSYLGGAKYFSTLDLYSGYWQMGVASDSKEKTAFVCPDGLYEFEVMPFGLTNAPASFQHLADTVFCDLKWKEVLIYLDDIVVFSNTFDEHLQRLRNVLTRLRQANLTLKPSKCFFAHFKVSLLGYVVSQEGLLPDESKLTAIQKFPTPKKVKDVQSFLGMCNYYRKFIKNFSQIARPLHDLTRKDIDFVWTSEHQNTFEELKHKLLTTPVLTHYDPKRDIELRVDACGYGIGGVLLQQHEEKWHPVAYISRSLTKAEKNYTVSELEALAVVWSLSYLRHLVYGKHIRIITDHHALCQLKTLKNPTGRLARWALKLAEHSYEIIHRPGRNHGDVDCLSRYPVEAADEEDELEAEEVPTYLLELADIRKWQEKDPELTPMMEALANGGEYTLSLAQRKRLKQFKLKDGCLFRTNTSRNGLQDLLVIPKNHRTEILYSNHNEPLAGHLGFAKCFKKISQRYYWDGLRRDVEKYIKGCPDCQARKGHVGLKPPGLLQPIEIPSHPFEKIGIDLLGPFRRSVRGKTMIVVATDYATRWVTAAALRDGTAKQVAQFLVDFVITKHGAPRYLLSDRGTVFRSELVTSLLKEMGTVSLFTTSYHPQTNGLTERFNKTLADMLSLFTNTKQTDWCLYIQHLVFAYNCAPQESTQFSPFRLVYGREAVLPTEANLLQKTGFNVSEFLARVEKERNQAASNIRHRQAKDKARYDSKHRDVQFQVGDKVKVYTPKRKVGLSDKLILRWHGPYEVVEKKGNVDYVIRMGTRRKPIVDTIHVNRILPYHASWEDENFQAKLVKSKESEDSSDSEGNEV
jgi:hypothetical protein